MAPLQLNTSTSIIDFLKSTGKPSDFSSRESLYKSSGLEARLGKYVSSGAQNVAFLKNLNTPTQTGDTTPTAPVDISSFTPEQRTAYDSAAALSPTPPATVGGPVKTTPEPIIGSSGLTASAAAGSIPQTPSADDILNSVLNSAGFQNFQQSQQLDKTLATGNAESQKASLESKSISDTKQFIDSMGRRGLFFSGETNTGLQSLAESLASSKLGIDRKLAGELLQSDFKTRDEIIKQVGDLVKQAQDGRKEAIASLEKVGLTVVGDQVVPTLAAQNAQLAAQREERLVQQAEFNNEATIQRLQNSADSAARSEEYLRLAENRAANANGDGINFSNSDKASVQLFSSTIDTVLGEPDANGQYATPDDAMQVAVAAAAARGTTLSTTNQVALLGYANERAAAIQKKMKEDHSASVVNSNIFAPSIEDAIASLSKSGILSKADIRASLARTYPKSEIDASSVGSGLTQIGNAFGGALKSLFNGGK